MSDLLVPVIVGVVTALVALIAHHLWMQRDALPARPDTRSGGGVARVRSGPAPEDARTSFTAPEDAPPSFSAPGDACRPLPVPGDSRRAQPAPGSPRRTLPAPRIAAPLDVPAATMPSHSVRLRPVMSVPGEAVREKGAGGEPLLRAPTADLPPAGTAIAPEAPHGGARRRRTDDTPPAPARPARTGPRPRRGRSTIQLDPFDALADPHNARIAVGGMIDDLETGRLGRGR